MKKILRTVFHRMVFVGLLLALQFFLIILMLFRFEEYFVYFYSISTLISIILVFYIINSRDNPEYKIAWILPVTMLPIFGVTLYFIFGGKHTNDRTQRKMSQIGQQMDCVLRDCSETMEKLEAESLTAHNQAHYIWHNAGCPIYENTYTEYIPSGEVKLEKMLEEIGRAEYYVFLEYFIIEEGLMWDAVRNLLVEKVKQGVDVRLIYDDMGSITTVPGNYWKKMEALGIKCCVFNPFVPVLSSRFNNRDHRKILVIDGHTGFTGGINLADEYINAYPKHGHWKDSAIMLKGEAVRSLTAMFLSMWQYLKKTKDECELYMPDLYAPLPTDTTGYVQPYADNPLDGEVVGETIYLNMISRAKKYVYITSPYLIIDNEMIMALSIAAKSGVDVRIVTPHHGDKPYVHAVTRAYYSGLIEAGVKIYEYTPGFIHAKNVVVDDRYCTVGTVNMDYRSLYLHFECGVWMYETDSVVQVKEDFMEILEVSQEITLEEMKKVPRWKKLIRAILRVFAPLM